jgi:hypothetical protein
MLAGIEFCQTALDMRTKYVRMVDDCGNIWFCIVLFETRPYYHFKIGGGWKRMAVVHRVYVSLLVFRKLGEMILSTSRWFMLSVGFRGCGWD